MKYFVVPDIHGQYDKINQLLNKILDKKKSDDMIVFLGDYVDRGSQSKEVIDLCYELSKRNDTIFLFGNHDVEFYNSIVNIENNDITSLEWLSRNSIETLQSYHIDCNVIKNLTLVDLVNIEADQSFESLFSYFIQEIKRFKLTDEFAKLSSFINHKCQYIFETDRYIFSHSGGVSFLKPEHHSNMQWLWSRDFKQRDYSDKLFVCGHTPVEEVTLINDCLLCDTGSVFTGSQLPYIILNELGDMHIE